MKKALIVLLLLALVAGGLFAQISFGAGVASGLLVAFDESGHTFYTSRWNGGSAYNYYFGGSYTAESGRAGGSIDFYGEEGGGWDFDGSKIWFKPLDILTLSGGGGGLGGFGTPGPGGTGNSAADIGVGLSMLLEPMAGFALGAAVGPVEGGDVVGNALYAFGLKFAQSGLFDARANLSYNGAGNDGDGQVNAAAGVSISALSNIAGLGISANIRANNVTKFADKAEVTAGAQVGFKAGDLGTTLATRLFLPLGSKSTLNAAVGVDLSYPIGAATANLGVGYVLKGAVEGSGKFNPGRWDAIPIGFSELNSGALAINPYINFKVADVALRVGYGLATNIGGTSKTKHEIYTGAAIDF